MFDLCVEYNSCSVMIIRLGNSQAHWNDDSTSRMEPLFAGRTSFLLQSRCVGGLTPATRANRDKQWEWTWCVAHQLGKNKYIHILYIYTYIYIIHTYIYIIYMPVVPRFRLTNLSTEQLVGLNGSVTWPDLVAVTDGMIRILYRNYAILYKFVR